MIISHKYKFIFIKTIKTAGTSIEAYLSQYCGESDILTPISPPIDIHTPRNYRGYFNPLIEIHQSTKNLIRHKSLLQQFLSRKKFFNHIPAWRVKARVDEKIWKNYFKFCVERNPWDKSLSHYHMLKNKFNLDFSFDEYIKSKNFCLNYHLYTDNKETNSIIVDQVIKYETLNIEIGKIFKELGIPFYGKLNVQAKSNYRKDKRLYQEIYTDEQAKVINEAFSKEIQMHNYNF